MSPHDVIIGRHLHMTKHALLVVCSWPAAMRAAACLALSEIVFDDFSDDFSDFIVDFSEMESKTTYFKQLWSNIYISTGGYPELKIWTEGQCYKQNLYCLCTNSDDSNWNAKTNNSQNSVTHTWLKPSRSLESRYYARMYEVEGN